MSLTTARRVSHAELTNFDLERPVADALFNVLNMAEQDSDFERDVEGLKMLLEVAEELIELSIGKPWPSGLITMDKEGMRRACNLNLDLGHELMKSHMVGQTKLVDNKLEVELEGTFQRRLLEGSIDEGADDDISLGQMEFGDEKPPEITFVRRTTADPLEKFKKKLSAEINSEEEEKELDEEIQIQDHIIFHYQTGINFAEACNDRDLAVKAESVLAKYFADVGRPRNALALLRNCQTYYKVQEMHREACEVDEILIKCLIACGYLEEATETAEHLEKFSRRKGFLEGVIGANATMAVLKMKEGDAVAAEGHMRTCYVLSREPIPVRCAVSAIATVLEELRWRANQARNAVAVKKKDTEERIKSKGQLEEDESEEEEETVGDSWLKSPRIPLPQIQKLEPTNDASRERLNVAMRARYGFLSGIKLFNSLANCAGAKPTALNEIRRMIAWKNNALWDDKEPLTTWSRGNDATFSGEAEDGLVGKAFDMGLDPFMVLDEGETMEEGIEDGEGEELGEGMEEEDDVEEENEEDLRMLAQPGDDDD